MTLADSSVWVNHFRKANPTLQTLLETRRVLIHPFILGELACGNLPQRTSTLRSLRQLPWAVVGRNSEVLELVESERLWGWGIGWVDAHLLASARLTGCRLWTMDSRLRGITVLLGIAAPG